MRVPSGADQKPLQSASSLEALMKEQAEAKAVLQEQVKLVEEAEEWQEYKSEVEFELDVLRSRYTNAGEPMSAQRLAQFQAHHRKLQMSIMQRAAAKAAKQLFLSMSSKERAKMRRDFGELEAAGHSLEVEDQMGVQDFQTAALDEGFSNLRLALAKKAHDEGRMSAEDLESLVRREREAVREARAADPERRRLFEEAVAGVGDPHEMPKLGPDVPAEVRERAAVEDRLLEMRAEARKAETEQLSAEVERQRALDAARAVLERRDGAGGAAAERAPTDPDAERTPGRRE